MKKPFNIFVIPSWTASPQNPFKGIFFKEQAEIFSSHYPDVNIGMSFWGQDDERLLLWANDHIWNIKKIFLSKRLKSTNTQVHENLREYFTPAFTWSRKLFGGNMKNIVKANLNNLLRFKSEYGRVDVIHAQVGFPAGYIAYHLSGQLNIPYVVTEQMSPLPFESFKKKNGDWIGELQKAYAKAAALIALTEAQKKIFESKGYSDVVVLNNFIDDTKFLPGKHEFTGTFKFLTIAGMYEQKGIDVLLHAIAILRDQKQNQNMMFHFVGDGEDLAAYKKLTTELAIENQIVWEGELDRDEVRNIMQSADVFILPSRHESFGVVVIEALACGKPCIVTRCGGPEELVSAEVGLVVEKEDPEALAKAILNMSENFHTYKTDRIRKYYENNFSAGKTTARLRKIYDKAIQAYQ